MSAGDAAAPPAEPHQQTRLEACVAVGTRLLRTTAFRLAVLYLGMFVLSVGVILLVVYRTTAGFLEQEIGETIALEVSSLQDHYRGYGLSGLIDVVRGRSAVAGNNSIYLLTTPQGVILAGNLSGWPGAVPSASGWTHFKVADYGGVTDRPSTAQAVTFTLPGQFRLLVGRDMSEIDQLRDRMVHSLGWILGVTAMLGLGGGLLLSRGAMRRIEAINRTTRQIMAGDLSDRVPRFGGGDEMDRLAGNLNAMLDRIERLMTGMRQVTDSVAHDLRTPLTRLRSRIELALIHDTEDPEVYRGVLQDTIAEADRLLATFTALLSIAEAESGAKRRDFVPVDLAEVVQLAADLYEPVAEERGQSLTMEIHKPATVRGNGQLLAQAVSNLLDNAIKYTPEGGRITLTLDGAGPGQAGRIVVADDGPGIPAGEREKVLQRFVRLDASRASPGNGLGLSLVDAVATLHGARLELSDNGPGLRVALVFPAEPGR
ncbi:HAMP domain-containing sensor histidine kinase [Azospirillum agricola]|uniref:HAMP domain-containing sensor histidine kinase n=1 Tax=Azospirillum agricola TaxID=1720247 RepID=UPI000A0F34B2|nr:HAMP domain-containing sensor histidine kinase [Azospirillum agricola]SMH58485.1 Signal transduction histidine kinase [Azospirillum lipoferum]